MTRNAFLSLLIAVCLVMSALALRPSVGVAQTGSTASGMDAAKKQMERGQELYMQRKYDEAAEAFAAAYAIQPYGAFLYNEAVCHQKLGNNDKALALFRKYLAADPGAPDADQVRERIRRIEEASKPQPTVEPDAAIEADADTDAGPEAGPPPTIVEEAGPDLMKSLVMIESDPSPAPMSIYFRTSPTAPPFQYGKDNPGWQKITSAQTPLNVTLQVGRYHIVMEPFADFQKSETHIDVAAGHIHQFKANLRQGEFMAFLRVTSPIPGARIYVDDPPPHKKPPWGRTPHEGLIGIGNHKIWVAKNGFETTARSFSVAHGEEREELVDLSRIPKGILRFSGNASAIDVTVDDNPVGTFHPGSPLDVEVPAGKHLVTASADGRKDLTEEIDVPHGQVLPIDLVMVPTTPRGAAWTQAVVSLAFLGGGVALKMQSDVVYDDVQEDRQAGTLTEADDRYTKGKIYAYGSTACFGVGGALALLSTYNFVKDPTPPSGARPGVPSDYPEQGSEPGAPSPENRRLLPHASQPRTRRTTSPPPVVSVLPAYDLHGAGLMLQGRF